MHVNTSVVKALMHLRGIDGATLANLVSTTGVDMHAWLYDIGEDSEERVPFDTQLEILKLLGINGETPRQDVVHYWRIHESLFSRPNDTYWSLQVLLKAFGKANAVFITREADPAFSFNTKVHFGLRFASFYAILEITAHPLRSISFDPETMPDMAWLPDTMGVLLPDAEYDALEPGAMKVRGLQQYLTYNTEVRQWERLRDAALEKGIRAEQVASLLLSGASADSLLSAKPEQAKVTAPVVEPLITKTEPVAAEPVAAAIVTPAAVAPAAMPETRADVEDFRLFSTPVSVGKKQNVA